MASGGRLRRSFMAPYHRRQFLCLFHSLARQIVAGEHLEDVSRVSACRWLVAGKEGGYMGHRTNLLGSILGDVMRQQIGFFSSSSFHPDEPNQSSNKEGTQAGVLKNTSHEKVNQKTSKEDPDEVASTSGSSDTEGSEEDTELSIDDLIKLVDEKEELLKLKHKEIEKMQEKVLRSYADVENVIDRTKREAENSKKFAIQNFAKALLDVADNLGRASSVVKDSFSKIDSSKDTGAVPLLKTLLEGVEMTDKQLTEVFRKFGVERFDPTGEHFDPHRHHAVFQIPDSSKPPGTVTAVLKPGYMLYERIIRPAEVGVTEALYDETEQPKL